MAFNPVLTNPAHPHADAVARLPRSIALRYDALPLEIADGVLLIGVSDLRDTNVLDALRAATRMRIRPIELPREEIREALAHAYGEPAPVKTGERDTTSPAVRAVDMTLAHAVGAHASDVHIEPSDDGGRIRLRVDGLLHDGEWIAPTIFPAFVSRLKLLAGMDIADRRTPQDGRCSIPFDGRAIDLRISSVPTSSGEKLVVRILDQHASTPDLARLGMAAEMYARYRQVLTAPWGFILVTGPTVEKKSKRSFS